MTLEMRAETLDVDCVGRPLSFCVEIEDGTNGEVLLVTVAAGERDDGAIGHSVRFRLSADQADDFCSLALRRALGDVLDNANL